VVEEEGDVYKGDGGGKEMKWRRRRKGHSKQAQAGGGWGTLNALDLTR